MVPSAIERDIEGRERSWIDAISASFTLRNVVWREGVSLQRNQYDGELTVFAEAVYVVPKIAAARDPAVEARSARIAEAASRPLKAAIGTPGPGWALPPAT